ncbi:endonuclease domain-containing protein [Streptomyces sp. NPDC056549]|uniref:endonuclease domain-containing protein n=1 Tax=Streptomyces sp. NPDC056549 TaxID=3345864 RepID=UPI0036A2C1E4
MWVSPQAAHQRLVDLTHHTAIPAYLDHVNRSTFAAASHVFIGEVPVQGHKRNQQWRFVDREVQKAAKRLAELGVDTGDLVDAGLDCGERRSWRSRVASWVDQAILVHGPDDRTLPEGFTGQRLPEEFVRRTIASTRPLSLLTWSGQVWLIPRGYAALLDRAAQAEADLSAQAAVCGGCGTHAQTEQWRSSSASGFVVLCPSCAAKTARPYTGHLRGRRYTKAFAKQSRADAFLCQMCPEPRRALYWDHCHSHGLFRGPLCVTCNNAEGGPGFLNRTGSVGHLLQCTQCFAQRTLPPQHHADVVRHLFDFTPHTTCTHERSWTWSRVQDDGSVLIQFQCYQHEPALQWSVTAPAEEVRLLVSRFVDDAISLEPGQDGERVGSK